MSIVTRVLFTVMCSLLVLSCSKQFDVTTPLSSIGEDEKILGAPPGFAKVPDQYVIVFNNSKVASTAVDGEAKGLAKKHGLALGYVYETAIRGFSATVSPGVLKRLAQEDIIERIEEDYTITVTPVTESVVSKSGTIAAYTRTAPQQVPWGIGKTGFGTVTSATGRAWIIDTGIDPNHPDLNVDQGVCINYVTGARQKSSTWKDQNGHGTHVAGTIAARNDGYDVVGVAPGARVVAVRCLDARGSGQYSWIIAGVNYIAAKGAVGDVCNMSLGGPLYAALNDAVKGAAAKKIKFAIAAGNESKDCTQTSPASTDDPYVWTVSAHNSVDAWASFSNYGIPVDVCAPGVNITSTKMGGGLTTMSGTSMATPHVAGILLLGPLGVRGTVTGDPDFQFTGKSDPLAKLGQ
jgi:subtilisin family serine protease